MGKAVIVAESLVQFCLVDRLIVLPDKAVVTKIEESDVKPLHLFGLNPVRPILSGPIARGAGRFRAYLRSLMRTLFPVTLSS